MSMVGVKDFVPAGPGFTIVANVFERGRDVDADRPAPRGQQMLMQPTLSPASIRVNMSVILATGARHLLQVCV